MTGAVLVLIAAGRGYTGYMLFSSKGRWQVTVTQGATELGVLVIEVV